MPNNKIEYQYMFNNTPNNESKVPKLVLSDLLELVFETECQKSVGLIYDIETEQYYLNMEFSEEPTELQISNLFEKIAELENKHSWA